MGDHVIHFGVGRFNSSLSTEQIEAELQLIIEPRKSFRNPFARSEKSFEGGYNGLEFGLTYLWHQGIQVRVPSVAVTVTNVAGLAEVTIKLEPSSPLQFSRVMALAIAVIMLGLALVTRNFEPLLFTVITSIDWFVKRRPLQDVADQILGLLQRKLRLTLIDFSVD
jgi:hypothetical protein